MFMNESIRVSDKIKRKGWDDSQYIVKNDGEDYFLCENGLTFKPTIDEVMADDWEPYFVTDFYQDVLKFNKMYKLTHTNEPTLRPLDSLKNFKSIIGEEMEEVDDIIAKYALLSGIKKGISEDDQLDILADLADWLGDVIVYCNTYALSWGLPMKEILTVIMRSNFSKLGEDGEPIYDERGKVEKGPNYWAPEPKLKELLKSRRKGTN